MYSRARGRPDCPASVFYAPAAYRRTALLREDAFEKGQRLKLFFCGGDFRLGLAGSSEDIAVLDCQRASIRLGPSGKTVGVVHDGPSSTRQQRIAALHYYARMRSRRAKDSSSSSVAEISASVLPAALRISRYSIGSAPPSGWVHSGRL